MRAGQPCATFLVPEVGRSATYRIWVGDSDRAPTQLSYDEITARSWSVRLAY